MIARSFHLAHPACEHPQTWYIGTVSLPYELHEAYTARSCITSKREHTCPAPLPAPGTTYACGHAPPTSACETHRQSTEHEGVPMRTLKTGKP